MGRKIYHTGYCPLLSTEREIILSIGDYDVVGSSGTRHSITGFQCPDAVDCKYRKESTTGLCPLVDTHTP